MNKKYKNVTVMMHTVDKGFSLASNVELVEIDINVFSEMDRQRFLNCALEAAGRFWDQMKTGYVKGDVSVTRIKGKDYE